MGWRGAAADFLKQGYNGRGGGLFKYMDGQVPGSGHTPSPSLVLLVLLISVLQPSASVAGYSYIPSVQSLPRFSSSNTVHNANHPPV